jgi:hypothetical protein
MAKNLYFCGVKLTQAEKDILDALGGNKSHIMRECVKMAGPELLRRRFSR